MIKLIQWIQAVDNIIIGFAQANLHSAIFNKIMPFISMIGNVGSIWIAIAVVFFLIPRYRKYGIMIICGILLTALTGEVIIKHLVERVRPCNVNTLVPMLIARPTDFSFPSGHTSSSFAATVVIWKANRKSGIIALLLAFLMAFSRLYIYVHYPSDLLAGMVLGLACGAMAIFMVNWSRGKVRNDNYILKIKRSLNQLVQKGNT